MMISVLLADDHDLVRQVLQRLLETEADIQIVAMVADGEEAVKQVVLHSPHVAVLDVSMPFLNGIEAAKQIHKCCPETRVLMLSMHNSPEYVHQGIQAGASGYLIKDGVSIDLIRAIHSLYQGNRFYSQEIADVAKHYLE